MKKITFEDFARTTSGRCAEALLADHRVKPKQIFKTIQAELELCLPNLVDGVRYTTEMLCDPDVWMPWLTAEHRVAGMCVAFMVRKGAIQLHPCFTKSGKRTSPATYSTQPMPQPLGRISTKTKRIRNIGVELQLMR